MKLENMDTPMTREEFERRLNILHVSIRDGKYHFCHGVGNRTIEELTKIRAMQNGRIDMLTIDESARLQANMSVMLEYLPHDMLDNLGIDNHE